MKYALYNFESFDQSGYSSAGNATTVAKGAAKERKMN